MSKLTEKHKRKLSESNKGKHVFSDESRRKLSLSHMGLHHTEEAKKKISLGHIGKHPSEEARRKMSETSKRLKRIPPHYKGKEHYNWQGGISFEPYTTDWKVTLKRSIRERDHYICGMCGLAQEEEALSVHHIDYDKKNCNPNNLISLHRKCHGKINNNRNHWKVHFMDKLNFY